MAKKKWSNQTDSSGFSATDIESVGEVMDSIIRDAGRPLEFDVLRERINDRLHLGYAKYFYGSFARVHANESGWYVRKTLCSSEPIPWNGLRAAYRAIYDSSRSKADNLSELRKTVLITDYVANGMISGWYNLESENAMHEQSGNAIC